MNRPMRGRISYQFQILEYFLQDATQLRVVNARSLYVPFLLFSPTDGTAWCNRMARRSFVEGTRPPNIEFSLFFPFAHSIRIIFPKNVNLALFEVSRKKIPTFVSFGENCWQTLDSLSWFSKDKLCLFFSEITYHSWITRWKPKKLWFLIVSHCWFRVTL